ncbi:MAG: cobalamin-dependent protein [Desulfobacteraceae bacterium]|nr:cobalamin-dependent protein [Desulfobacteraceae bacterium]
MSKYYGPNIDEMMMSEIKQRIEQFVKREGRRPRILVSNMDKKSHNHDTRLMAAFFAESGFDVDISPPHQTPRGTARMAIENDVHVICFLSTENRHKHLVCDLAKALEAEEAENVKIVVGGAKSRSDERLLNDTGVDLELGSVPLNRTVINQLLNLFE